MGRRGRRGYQDETLVIGKVEVDYRERIYTNPRLAFIMWPALRSVATHEQA
jgi:hypothetical protein